MVYTKNLVAVCAGRDAVRAAAQGMQVLHLCLGLSENGRSSADSSRRCSAAASSAYAIRRADCGCAIPSVSLSTSPLRRSA